MSSNHAKTCKESILVDVKELLKLYDRVTIHLPRIRREHSAVKRFEDAAYNIIHNFTIAFEMRNEDEKQMKRMYVERIICSFGEMLAAFEILIDLRDKLSDDWWQWLEWNDKKKCLAYKEEFSVKSRLNRKYKLNLKVLKNEQNGIRRAA